MMRNPTYNAYFWATFGGKMSLATMRTPNGLGSPNPTKKLAHLYLVNLLGKLLSLNHVFDFLGGPPPLTKFVVSSHSVDVLSVMSQLVHKIVNSCLNFLYSMLDVCGHVTSCHFSCNY